MSGMQMDAGVESALLSVPAPAHPSLVVMSIQALPPSAAAVGGRRG